MFLLLSRYLLSVRDAAPLRQRHVHAVWRSCARDISIYLYKMIQCKVVDARRQIERMRRSVYVKVCAIHFGTLKLYRTRFARGDRDARRGVFGGFECIGIVAAQRMAFGNRIDFERDRFAEDIEAGDGILRASRQV